MDLMDQGPTSPTGPVAFAPTNRPVRRLVAVIIAAGLVSVVLWWFGAVGPRVTISVRSVGADTAAGRGTLHIEVRNDGRLPVDVRGVSVDDRQGPSVEVAEVRVDGHLLGRDPVRVATGQVVRLDVAYAVDCNRPGGYGADPSLGVRVEAPLGTTQTRTVGSADVYRLLSGGDGSVDPGPLLCPSAVPLLPRPS